MAFDIIGAKNSGYSDTEIADFLSSQGGFDAGGARNAGYSDQEIIGQLSGSVDVGTTQEQQKREMLPSHTPGQVVVPSRVDFRQSGNQQSVTGMASPNDRKAAQGARTFINNDIPAIASTFGAKIGAGLEQSVGGLIRAAGEARTEPYPSLPTSREEYSRELAAEAQRKDEQIQRGMELGAEGRSIQNIASQEHPVETRAGKIIDATVSSIGANLPGMAATMVTGVPALGLSMMGLQSFGQAYDESRAAGLDIEKATNSAVIQGGTEVATELLPFVHMAKFLKEGNLSTKVLHYYLSEVPGEHVATAVQNATGKYYEKPGMTDDQRKQAAIDYLVSSEHGQDQIDTFFTTLLQTAVMGGIAKVARSASTVNENRGTDPITSGMGFAQPSLPPGTSSARVDKLSGIMAADTPEAAAQRLAARQQPATQPLPTLPVPSGPLSAAVNKAKPILPDSGVATIAPASSGMAGPANAFEVQPEIVPAQPTAAPVVVPSSVALEAAAPIAPAKTTDELALDEARAWAKDRISKGQTQHMRMTQEPQSTYDQRLLNEFNKSQIMPDVFTATDQPPVAAAPIAKGMAGPASSIPVSTIADIVGTSRLGRAPTMPANDGMKGVTNALSKVPQTGVQGQAEVSNVRGEGEVGQAPAGVEEFRAAEKLKGQISRFVGENRTKEIADGIDSGLVESDGPARSEVMTSTGRGAVFYAEMREELQKTLAALQEQANIPDSLLSRQITKRRDESWQKAADAWNLADKTEANELADALGKKNLTPAQMEQLGNAVDSGDRETMLDTMHELVGASRDKLRLVDKAAPQLTPLDANAHDAAASPLNSIPEPTPSQIEAGNYKKGHLSLHGLDISIENPYGSTRSGTDPDGKPWSVTMNDHYGYIKGTVGKDKDHVDVFVKPGIDQSTAGDRVFVVDQIDPKTGQLDEHKVMMGYGSEGEAKAAYLSNHDKSGASRIGAITDTTVDHFKLWLEKGDTNKVFKFDHAKEGAERNRRQAQNNAANDRATALGTPAALAAQDKFENGGMKVEDFEKILDGESAARAGNTAAAAQPLSKLGLARMKNLESKSTRTVDEEALYQRLNARHLSLGMPTLLEESAPVAKASNPASESGSSKPAPIVPVPAVSPSKPVVENRKINRQEDDIVVAISKLGGIDFAQAQAEWGDIVKDSRKTLSNHVRTMTRRFGAVFKNDGKSLEQMRESLADHGYLPEGADLHDLYTAIEDATRGTFALSSEASHDGEIEQAARDYEERTIEGMTETERDAYSTITNEVEAVDVAPGGGNSFDFGYNTEGYEYEARSKSEDQSSSSAAHPGIESEGDGPGKVEAEQKKGQAETTDDAGGWSQGVAVAGKSQRSTIGRVQKQGGDRTSTSDLMDGFTPEPAGLFDTPAAALQEKAATPVKLEDFGEKIGGARKDFSAKFAAAKGLDIATEPFAKSWPEPDYAKMPDQGYSGADISLLRAIRDEIPDKPRQAWKVKQWAELVKSLRGHAEEMLKGESDTVRKVMDQTRGDNSAVRNILGRAELYDAAGHDVSLRGVTLSKNHWDFYKGEKNVTKWQVEQKQKATAFSNMPRDLGTGNTKAEAIEDFKSKISDLQPEEAKGKKPTEFVVYSKRGKPGYFIGKKIGKDYLDLKTFPGILEARTFLKENRPVLETQMAGMKDMPYERREKNSPRTGEDVRGGRDATPEMFQAAYGFRGVEFGVYLNAADRKRSLNEAFDALHDLAGILGIPTKAVSLDGELGLAFGARGHGGKRAAAAHYESDRVVINLTKNNGAGSLSHEFFHALDSYFSRKRGYPGEFITNKAVKYGAQDVTRQEVVDAFKSLKDALDATNLKQRSRNLDKTRTKDYWSTGIEMHARAFENYVIDKLSSDARENDYLANIKGMGEYAEDLLNGFGEGKTVNDLYPYLLSTEIESVSKAFDNLFTVMQTEETEKGTALFETEAQYNAGREDKPYTVSAVLPARAGDTDSQGADGVREQLAFFTPEGTPTPEARQVAEVASSKIRRFTKTARVVTGHVRTGLTHITSPQDLAHVMAGLRKKTVENFVIVVTDAKDKIVGIIDQTTGTVNQSLVHPSLVLSASSLVKGAKNIYLVHNHPTGDPTFSAEDRAITKRIFEASQGTGLVTKGIMAIGSKTATFHDPEGYLNEGPFSIPAMVRTEKIPVEGARIFTKRPLADQLRLTAPSQIPGALSDAGIADHGVMLLDGKNRLVAFVPMKGGEMGVLRTGTTETGAGILIKTLRETNAVAMIAVTPEMDQARNLGSFGEALGVQLLDIYNPETMRSATESGMDTKNGGMFNDVEFTRRQAEIIAIDRVIAKENGIKPATGGRQLMLPQIRKAIGLWESDKISDGLFINTVKGLHSEMEVRAAEKRFMDHERVRGADFIREKILNAKRNGDITQEHADFVEWFAIKNESLLDGLGISIKQSRESGIAGQYNPAASIISLFKGSQKSTTGVHEILHHMERMMPTEMQDGIRSTWLRAITAEIKNAERAKNTSRADFLRAAMDAELTGSTKALKDQIEKIQTGKIDYSDYKYTSPSEYWAVSLTDRTMVRFKGSPLGKAAQWLKEAWEHIKKVLGLRSDAPIYKAFDSIVKGNGELVSKDMIGKIAQNDISDALARLEPVADYAKANWKGLLNPLDWSRTAHFFDDFTPTTIKAGLGYVLAAPHFEAERDASKKAFVEVGADREISRMELMLAFFGYTPGQGETRTKTQQLKEFFTKWHSGQESTKWEGLNQRYAGLDKQQNAAINVLAVQGDANNVHYSSLRTALMNPKVKAAGLTQESFDLYREVHAHMEMVAELRATWTKEMMERAGISQDRIDEHIARYRQEVRKVEGWLSRNHGQGEFATSVHHVIKDLPFTLRDIAGEAQQAFLPFYPGNEAMKLIETLAGDSAVTTNGRGQVIVTAKEGQNLNAFMSGVGEIIPQVGEQKVKVYARYHTSKGMARRHADQVRGSLQQFIPENFHEGETYETTAQQIDVLTEGLFQNMKNDMAMEAGLQQAFDRAFKTGELDKDSLASLHDSLIQDTAEILLGRAAGKYQIRRAPYLIEGYDTSNLMENYQDYMTSVAGMLSKADYAGKQFKHLTKTDIATKPWAYKYVFDSLRNMGLGDRISGNVRAFVALWYMGLKPASALINATQIYTLGVAEIGKISKGASATMIIGRAQKDVLTGKLSVDEQAVFDSAVIKQQEAASAMAAITGHNEGSTGKASKLLHGITGKTMALFQNIEIMNRKTMILAAYRTLRKPNTVEGIIDEKALQRALDINNNTNFDQGRHNLPGWARGPWGHTFYALQSFTWNNFNWLYNHLTSGEKQDQLALLRYTGMLMLIGGAAALSGGDELDKLYRKLYGKSLMLEAKEWTKEHAKEYGTMGELADAFAWNGLGGVAGLNISNSIRLQMPVVSQIIGDSTMPEAFAGVYSGLAKKALFSSLALSHGDVYRAAEYAAPEAVAGALRAYRQYDKGMTTLGGKPIFDEHGKPLKYSATDAALRVAGFQPAEQSRRMEVAMTGKALQGWWKDERSGLLIRLRLAKRSERAEVRREIIKFNRALRESQAFGLVSFIKAETMRNALTAKPDKRKLRWSQDALGD